MSATTTTEPYSFDRCSALAIARIDAATVTAHPAHCSAWCRAAERSWRRHVLRAWWAEERANAPESLPAYVRMTTWRRHTRRSGVELCRWCGKTA